MTTNDDAVVRLSDLWPRMGFSLMPLEVRQAMKDAIRRHRPRMGPPDMPAGMKMLYGGQLARWGVRIEDLRPDASAALQTLEDMPLTPAYRQLSLADIRVRIGEYAAAEIEPGKEVIWRWPYYQFAYTVVWALIFHEPNATLANPRFLLREIFQLWQFIHSDVEELYDDLERKKRICWLAYAMLERICGTHYDIAQNLPHYRANITQRTELIPSQRAERRELFAGAVDHLEEHCYSLLIHNCAK